MVNLITALKVGIDHDRLHYDDVLKMVAPLRPENDLGIEGLAPWRV